MRTFALLILALNLGYLIWSQAQGADDVIAVSPGELLFVQAGTSLLMLAELPPSSFPLQVPESIGEIDSPVSTLSEPLVESRVSPSPSPAQPGAPQAWCGVVSGFDDQAHATAFISELSAMDVVGSLDIQQEQVSSTWWVHLPPFESQLEAQSVIDELVGKGIDNFYMRTGELAGGVSLGVFSRKPSAEIAQAELLERGYQTSIKEIPRYLSKVYATIKASDSAVIETPEWKAFLATKTKLEVTEKLCETIAR